MRLDELIAAHVRDVPDFPKPGILFKDITPLLAAPEAFRGAVDGIVAAHPEFDIVAGVEARGFLLAAAIGYAASAGVVPVRKAGKLPGPTISTSYSLEYGDDAIEVHADAVAEGQRVLVVDDVLATGGTLAGTLELMRQLGADVVGVSVILELTELGGRARVAPQPVHTLLAV